MPFLESLSDVLQISLFVLLPVVILGFMVYVTYVSRKARNNKIINKKEK